jgi:hypothetical protein
MLNDTPDPADAHLVEDWRLKLNERYRAASSEIAQRLNLRQISYLGHAVAVGTIFKAYFDAWPKPDLDGRGFFPAVTPSYVASPSKHIDVIASILIVFPAIINFAFACWIRSHDITVGLLSTYCRLCESILEKDPKDPHLNYASFDSLKSDNFPSWHSSWQGWQQVASRQRGWIELAFVLLAFLCSVIAYCYSHDFIKIHPDSTRSVTNAMCANSLLLGVSSWLVLTAGLERSRMRNLAVDRGKLRELPDETVRQTPADGQPSLGPDTPPPAMGEYRKTMPHPMDLITLITILVGISVFVFNWIIPRPGCQLKERWPGYLILAIAAPSRVLGAWLDYLHRRKVNGGALGFAACIRATLRSWWKRVGPEKSNWKESGAPTTPPFRPHLFSGYWLFPISVFAFVLYLLISTKPASHEAAVYLTLAFLGFGISEVLSNYLVLNRSLIPEKWLVRMRFIELPDDNPT